MPSAKIKVEGLSECLEILEKELPKATQKNVIKRALLQLADPIIQDAKAAGSYKDRTGKLRKSITVSTKLNKSNVGDQIKSPKRVEVFVGPSKIRYDHLVEFGTYIARPFPFMRPAWESNKRRSLEDIKVLLWKEIEKAVERKARKAAREAAKGG